MQGKYILSVLVVILLVCSPVAASTNKIATGAPVFIGESKLDISSAIQDCHVIAWWSDEGNRTGPAAKNLTIKRVNDVILPVNQFNITPGVFQGYTGNWYCEDKKPAFVVLKVMEPALSIRIWDVDNDKDVSGQAVPYSTNITYRIDTNLNQALSYHNRTDLTPADGFFTVRLTNPSGGEMLNFYTGSVGGADTQILSFDSTPFITSPAYFGKKLESWNRLSRDASGSLLYPPGTYTFTVTQNLGRMQESFASAGVSNLSGITTASASITLLPQESPTQVPVSPRETVTTAHETGALTATIPEPTVPAPVSATTVPAVKKTTYSPLPVWVAAGSLFIALILITRSKK